MLKKMFIVTANKKIIKKKHNVGKYEFTPTYGSKITITLFKFF